jgi:hypothetical protein
MIYGMCFTTSTMMNQSLSNQALLSTHSKTMKKKHMKITGLFLSEAQRLIHGGTFRGISPQSQLRQLLWNW